MKKAKRKPIPGSVRLQVLTEAGFKCGNPICRNVLALDIHHMEEVAEGGGNTPANLLALCPMCHALYTRGEIPRDAIYAWKLMLVSLNHAFDQEAIDDLLFLGSSGAAHLRISGDGVLRFARLIGSCLAAFKLVVQNGPLLLYRVELTQKGGQLIDAWRSGDRNAVEAALGGKSNLALRYGSDD